MTVSWQPILKDAKADRALEAVLAIADALCHINDKKLDDPSLAHGRAGLAIFFAYLAQATSEAAAAELAVDHLEKAIAQAASISMGPTLFSGVTGVVWAARHLNRRIIELEDEEIFEPVDESIASLLTQTPWMGDYDLISGLVGFGVYFLERLPNPKAVAALILIIEHLEQMAEVVDDGRIAWLTRPELLPPWQRERAPKGYYNLGQAHGIPGIISLLAEYIQHGIAKEKAWFLLRGAVDWLLEQKLPVGGESIFPYWIGPGIERGPTRVAWCYGDLGVAAALLYAARSTSVLEWEVEAKAISRLAALRFLEQSGVKDAGLCHGAAGNGLLFNRLFQATQDNTLRQAAVYWFDRTLELRRHSEGIAGFLALESNLSDIGKHLWKPQPGILTGAAGIGLALLSAIYPIEPAWDRMLLTSIPLTAIR